jgi:hypothetical protein
MFVVFVVFVVVVVVDVLMGRRMKWEERRRRRGRRAVDGKKLSARMTSETTSTNIVEGFLWKMRGSIEKFVFQLQWSDGGVQSCVKQGGEFGSDDDCGNGGALTGQSFTTQTKTHIDTCSSSVEPSIALQRLQISAPADRRAESTPSSTFHG